MRKVLEILERLPYYYLVCFFELMLYIPVNSQHNNFSVHIAMTILRLAQEYSTALQVGFKLAMTTYDPLKCIRT